MRVMQVFTNEIPSVIESEVNVMFVGYDNESKCQMYVDEELENLIRAGEVLHEKKNIETYILPLFKNEEE